MPCPLFHEAEAPSPLPDTPAKLRSLADAVLEWGKTYSGQGGVRGGGIISLYTASAGRDASAASCDTDDAVRLVAAGIGVVVSQKVVEDDREKLKGRGNDAGGGASVCNGGQQEIDSEVPLKGNNGMGDTHAAVLSGAENGSDADGNRALTGDDPAEPSVSYSPADSRGKPPWETGRFVLELQAPWAKRLLDGEKTVETRSYPLPAGLVGRPIEVMESQPGQDGVSALGDRVEALSTGLSVLGRVVFSKTEAYASREAWENDESRHLVPSSSAGYGWKSQKGAAAIHGWFVGEVTPYVKPRAVRGMTRALRSLFEVEQRPSHQQQQQQQPQEKSISLNGVVHHETGGNGTDRDGYGSHSIEQKTKNKSKKKRKRKGSPATAIATASDSSSPASSLGGGVDRIHHFAGGDNGGESPAAGASAEVPPVKITVTPMNADGKPAETEGRKKKRRRKSKRF